MLPWTSILCPTDFSTSSQSALDAARELADQFHATLHLLHIVQDLALVMPESPALFMDAIVPVGDLVQAAEESLAQLAAADHAAGRKVVSAVRTGSPFTEILRYAQEIQSDLIVIGTHGRTGLSHVFLGSVAENTVRLATCPVLTVRPPPHSRA